MLYSLELVTTKEIQLTELERGDVIIGANCPCEQPSSHLPDTFSPCATGTGNLSLCCCFKWFLTTKLVLDSTQLPARNTNHVNIDLV